MVKKFTVDDVVEVIKPSYITGISEYWCFVLFKGCKNPVEFYACPTSDNELSQELYIKIANGDYGELIHGLGEFRTKPMEQEELEGVMRTKRTYLLQESDFIELPSWQAKLSADQKKAWETYRQELRDIPETIQFPWDPQWPEKPKL